MMGCFETRISYPYPIFGLLSPNSDLNNRKRLKCLERNGVWRLGHFKFVRWSCCAISKVQQITQMTVPQSRLLEAADSRIMLENFAFRFLLCRPRRIECLPLDDFGCRQDMAAAVAKALCSWSDLEKLGFSCAAGAVSLSRHALFHSAASHHNTHFRPAFYGHT